MSNVSALKWTIGIVNYKSSVYLKWQLKGYFEFNDPATFEFIIVDNSRPHERERLESLTREYREKYDNIQVVFHEPVEKSASGQHGEGLDIILAKTRTQYLLVQDPDFFWVRPGHLTLLQDEMERNGYSCIGAPYPDKVGLGDPWYPAAYGCAYPVADLRGLDFSAFATEEKRQESFDRYPPKMGFGYSFDVGWKIREALSNRPFSTFSQRVCYELRWMVGRHSFETLSREYYHQGEPVAFHLFRGTFTGKVTETHEDPQAVVAQKWLQARDAYGSFFYRRLLSYSARGGLWMRFKFSAQTVFYRIIFAPTFNAKSIYWAIRVPVVELLKRSKRGKNLVSSLKNLRDRFLGT